MTKLSYPPYNVLVANVGGTFYAVEDACPHSGASLSQGRVEGETVVCPAHDWQIDLRDGRVLTAAGGGDSNPTFRAVVEDTWVVVFDDRPSSDDAHECEC